MSFRMVAFQKFDRSSIWTLCNFFASSSHVAAQPNRSWSTLILRYSANATVLATNAITMSAVIRQFLRNMTLPSLAIPSRTAGQTNQMLAKNPGRILVAKNRE